MNNKEIVEARDNLRENLENDIKINKKKNEQIGKIVYYEDFELINECKGNLGLIENEVFIVTRNVFGENDSKICMYEIYDEHQNLLAKTDKEGKLTYTESYKEKLKNNFPLTFTLSKNVILKVCEICEVVSALKVQEKFLKYENENNYINEKIIEVANQSENETAINNNKDSNTKNILNDDGGNEIL